MFNQSNPGAAYANIRGGNGFPEIRGQVTFRQHPQGVLITARVSNLPCGADNMGVFAFHIHEGESCTGNSSDEFANTGGHYNPKHRPHPYHAGDLPPLFCNNGFAYMSVFTSRFTVNEIIGKTIIIHSEPDDFTSQPSGNAGEKIACGKIMRG